ncbi:MAG: NAD(P)/FAD-dependent oxidoreductase, partial [Candidatus Bathyarchaeota archaeon]|nr:NAD(P)/FAD-dependent oxidoreductase [Candidatus Bathyarchaeota archaeon]
MGISIIGAGPSGCIAGASASDEGHTVTIYEEHKKIGIPEQCGGLLSKTATNWFSKLGIKCNGVITNKIFGTEIHSGKTEILIKDRSPKAFVIRRAEFDQQCADFAEDKGTKIILGQRLSPNKIRQLNSNSFIIGSDGPHSTVAKTLKFPEIRDYAIAYQKDITNLDLSKQETGIAQIYLYENSFGWLIPLDKERAHVGILFFRNPELRRFDWFLEEIRKKSSKNRLKTENFFTDVIPVSVRPRIQKKNAYLVGDAAGQVKATSGGGIYYGCRSAWLAGKTLETKDYEQRWKKEIGRSLEQHNLLRKIVNKTDPGHLGLLL